MEKQVTPEGAGSHLITNHKAGQTEGEGKIAGDQSQAVTEKWSRTPHWTEPEVNTITVTFNYMSGLLTFNF